jgi:hypothetical protein
LDTSNRRGTVEIGEEVLSGKIVHLLLPKRHVKLITDEGFVISSRDEDLYKESDIIQLYSVVGTDFNQVANLLHYSPDQISFEEIDGNELFCVVDYEVVWDRECIGMAGSTTHSSVVEDTSTYLKTLAVLLKQNILAVRTTHSYWDINVKACPHYTFVTGRCGDSDINSNWRRIDSLYGVEFNYSDMRDSRTPDDSSELNLLNDGFIDYGDYSEHGCNIWPRLLHGRNHDWSVMFPSIIDEIAVLFFHPEQIEARKLERLKSTLSQYFRTVPENKINQLQERYDICRRDLQSLQTNVNNKATEVSNAYYELSIFKKGAHETIDVEKSIADVFELVDKSAEFTSFYIEGSYLVVETDDIFITHPDSDDVYYLGRFAIKIDPINQQVHLPNSLKPPRRDDNSYTHPHVFAYDDMCWGNISSTIYDLIRTGEFVQVLHLIANYLRHVNGHLNELEEYWYTVEECEERGVVFNK